jgi:hypothetical protein
MLPVRWKEEKLMMLYFGAQSLKEHHYSAKRA